MEKISQEIVVRLLKKADMSNSGIARNIYNDKPESDMQLMLIAFSKNIVYEYIRDDCEGKMIYICVSGTLTIKTMEVNNELNFKEQTIKSGESIVLNRNIWRKTTSGSTGAVFLECIEGQFDKSNRRVK